MVYALVQVVPNSGWQANVQSSEGEQLSDRDAVEAWLRDQLKFIVKYQQSRGGGIFVLPVPVEQFT